MVAGPQYFIASQEGFTSHTLDFYLAAGYYRMQHLIFTTHFIKDAESEIKHPVFWLRTNLKKLRTSRTAALIKNKAASFSVNYKQATVNAEIETLYNVYKNSLTFQLAANCYECLHQQEITLPYDSKIIEIRKDETLIAAGFFDCGQNSLAGILNIYHPDYKKFSLGKLLMLLKIEYAINQNMNFYYTGYFSTRFSKFDYKIFPDPAAMEIYLPNENCWIPYESISKEYLNEYAKKHFAI